MPVAKNGYRRSAVASTPAASEATIVPTVPAAPKMPCAVELRPGWRGAGDEHVQRRRGRRERRALHEPEEDHEPDLGDQRVQRAAERDPGHAEDEGEEPALAVDEAADERRQDEDGQREREEREPDGVEPGARARSGTGSRRPRSVPPAKKLPTLNATAAISSRLSSAGRAHGPAPTVPSRRRRVRSTGAVADACEVAHADVPRPAADATSARCRRPRTPPSGSPVTAAASAADGRPQHEPAHLRRAVEPERLALALGRVGVDEVAAGGGVVDGGREPGERAQHDERDGPTMNSGSTAKTDASSRPMTIIALREARSATQPKSGSPSSRAAGHAATTIPSIGRATPWSAK